MPGPCLGSSRQASSASCTVLSAKTGLARVWYKQQMDVLLRHHRQRPPGTGTVFAIDATGALTTNTASLVCRLVVARTV